MRRAKRVDEVETLYNTTFKAVTDAYFKGVRWMVVEACAGDFLTMVLTGNMPLNLFPIASRSYSSQHVFPCVSYSHKRFGYCLRGGRGAGM